MGKIKAVVFDLDGTLLDTSEHVLQAFEHLMKEHGVEPSREQIVQEIGPPLVDCYKKLLPNHDPEILAGKHHELQQSKEFLSLVSEYAHMRQAVAALREMGLKIAIFTNRWRPGLELLFDALELGDEFDTTVTPDDVKRGKPDPEGLQIISFRLKIPPSSFMMVGDLPVDIEVGTNAHVALTVGITHGFGSRKALEEAGADYIVDSLEEIRALVERVNHGED